MISNQIMNSNNCKSQFNFVESNNVNLLLKELPVNDSADANILLVLKALNIALHFRRFAFNKVFEKKNHLHIHDYFNKNIVQKVNLTCKQERSLNLYRTYTTD